VTDFEGLRCAVSAGDGVVARFPGVVCVMPAPDQRMLVLIELCQESAGSAPGRLLARRIASWLGGMGETAEELIFGTVASTGDDGLAVFLTGPMRVLIPDLDVEISGTESAAWTDRLIARPDTSVVLTAAGVARPLDATRGLSDLRAGVAPGAAAVLLPVDAMPVPRTQEPRARRAPARPQPPADSSATMTVARPQPPVESARQPAPPRRAEAILGVTDDQPRPPLPTDAPAKQGKPAAPPKDQAAAPEDQTARPEAVGHLCARGHLNDPRSHFCVLCGIRMNERTGVLVTGSRPPLGLLVFESGLTYTVDAGYLIGRMPDADERVRTGALRAITMDDPAVSMSRVHAEVRLTDWDVELVDLGSSNGTSVAAPEQDWMQLIEQQPYRLAPGTRVRLGNCTFVFESPSGVR